MNSAATRDPAERFALVIDGLCRAVAARSRGNAMSGALIVLLWRRLRRSAGRFAALAAALRAGARPLPHPPHSAPRPEYAEPGQLASDQRARRKRGAKLLPDGQPDRLPDGLYRRRGWLVRLVPEAGVCASQLERLLADPDTAAMALASPPLARLLRSLCRMLAVDPGTLPPPPRRRSAAAKAPDPADDNAAIAAPRDAHGAAILDEPEPMPRRRWGPLVRPAWQPPW